MANRKLYYSDHPHLDSYGAEIIALVNNYFNSTGVDELYIGIIDGFFVFEGIRLYGPSVAGKQLLQFAETLHCGGFGLQRGLTLKEIKLFFDVTALHSLSVATISDARALFGEYGIRRIRIGAPYLETFGSAPSSQVQVWQGQETTRGELQSPGLLYQELYNVVARAYGNAAADQNLNIDETRSVSEFMLRYIQSSIADVMQYVHYPDYDSYTVGHSVRVSSLAVYIGTKMNWAEKDLLAIGSAGLLHDIGKSRIPSSILFKKGRLDEEEFAVIRQHPQAGTEILLAQEGVSALDLTACWGHHLRYDGNGYPEQPAWAVRHPITALLQICDVFEALTAVRPYKPALDPHGAFSVMISDKGAFHPGLLAAFIAAVGLYPPGTYVRLTDNRVAIVTEAGEMIDRPRLNIITSEHGEPLRVDEQYQIDLSVSAMTSLSVKELLLDYRR